MKDSIDLVIIQGVLKVLVLRVVVKVFVESRAIDSVYIDMLMDLRKRFSKEGVVSLGISGMSRVKIFQLITRLRNSQGLLGPVDGGVCDMKPGKSKDDVLLSTAHDIEEMLLSDPFNVHIEGTSIADYTGLVHGLVNIANHNRKGEFLSGEVVFLDKLPVYTRDISTRIYQCGGINDFEGMRRGVIN